MVVSKPEGRSERSSAGNMGFIYTKKKPNTIGLQVSDLLLALAILQ